MKIGILGIKGIPGHHGVEVVVDSLVPHLSDMGHKVTVYGYESYTDPIDDYNGARIKTVRGSLRKNIEMISHMWKASLDSRHENFDIIHIHSTDPCLLAWLPKARYGIVATSHGQAYVRKKWSKIAGTVSKIAERFFIYYPNVTTSVSMPLAKYYNSKYNKDVLYIPNGMTFREKPDESFLEKWKIEPQKFLFCSAGRIERTKGVHTLFEAYASLHTELPLVIAGGGTGSDLAYLEELKNNKPDGVIFAGFLGGDEFYSLYAHARIFVFPSEYEAMSIALLEGLSFGTPTIFSNIPENAAVANGFGYPFEVSNAKSLATQMGYVLKNYDKALERGAIARDTVKQRHDWSVIAQQYNDIYLKMAEGKE